MIETQTELIMGMPITLSLAHDSAKMRREGFTRTFARFTEVDERFSPFKPTSELSRMNEGDIAYDDISNDMREVLSMCAMYETLSNGYFRHVRNGILDPTGLVKSWAIARAGELLKSLGISNALINAGGDMLALGTKDTNVPWMIGVKFPSNPGAIVKHVALWDHAIATSGSYERGLHIDGLDDQPTNPVLSVTVVSSDIIQADCLATAAFAMGPGGIDFLESVGGVEAFILLDEARAVETSGFTQFEAEILQTHIVDY